jgi:hypothetical protein
MKRIAGWLSVDAVRREIVRLLRATGDLMVPARRRWRTGPRPASHTGQVGTAGGPLPGPSAGALGPAEMLDRPALVAADVKAAGRIAKLDRLPDRVIASAF